MTTSGLSSASGFRSSLSTLASPAHGGADPLTKTNIVELQENGSMNTECAGRTTSLFCAHRSDRLSGRQVGLRGVLLTARYDYAIDIGLFPSVARKQRPRPSLRHRRARTQPEWYQRARRTGPAIILPINLQPVRRTPHSSTPSIQHVGVHHCGRRVAVAQQLLNGPDIVAVLQTVESRMNAATCGRSPRLVIPFLLTASLIACWITDSCRWCQPSLPMR